MFITSGKKIFYRFILTVLIAFLPLTFVSLKGFSIDFYNASIEFIFLLIFIYGFVSFNIIFRELPFYLILIEKNKLIYNLVYSISLILVSIFLGHESFLYSYLYLLLFLIEFSKTFCLFKGLINKKNLFKYIDYVPLVFILLEFFNYQLENTSAVILILSFFISLIIYLFCAFIIYLFKLKIYKTPFYLFLFFGISALFIILIFDINFFEKYFYKIFYVIDTISDISNLNIFDIENLIIILENVPEDSVAARFLEIMNIISTSGTNYLGILVESGSINSILAHSSIATLSFKYGTKSIMFLVLLLLNPINRTSRESLSQNNNILILLPVLILAFDNQGDYITVLFLGFGFRALKDYLTKIIAYQKSFDNLLT